MVGVFVVDIRLHGIISILDFQLSQVFQVQKFHFFQRSFVLQRSLVREVPLDRLLILHQNVDEVEEENELFKAEERDDGEKNEGVPVDRKFECEK